MHATGRASGGVGEHLVDVGSGAVASTRSASSSLTSRPGAMPSCRPKSPLALAEPRMLCRCSSAAAVVSAAMTLTPTMTMAGPAVPRAGTPCGKRDRLLQRGRGEVRGEGEGQAERGSELRAEERRAKDVERNPGAPPGDFTPGTWGCPAR